MASLQGSNAEVIAASEGHKLCTKIHDTVDSDVSKWVGNTAHILAYLFYFASKQHHEVWASKFPFLQSIKDTVPPSEACLYGYISWSLTQACQQSSLGLSQSSTSVKVSGPNQRIGLGLMYRSDLCQSLVVIPLCKEALFRYCN